MAHFPQTLKISHAAALAGLSLAVGLGISGCAPSVDRAIESPNLSEAVQGDTSLQKTQAVVSIDEIRDFRSETFAEDITQPVGDIDSTVRDGLSEALQKRGATISTSAPVKVSGQVKKWQTKITSGANTELESEALLTIEVADLNGKTLFTGEYSGQRSSKFPFVSREDVKDSLAMAMSGAITHALNDSGFLRAIER